MNTLVTHEVDVEISGWINNMIFNLLGNKYSNFRISGKEITIDSSHYSTLFSYTIDLNMLIIQSGELKMSCIWNHTLNRYYSDSNKNEWGGFINIWHKDSDMVKLNAILNSDDYMIWLCRQQLISLGKR